jgi:hypothetical protein
MFGIVITYQHTPSFTWDSYGSVRLPLIMQGVSKELYNFESLYKFIQTTCTVFGTVIM